MMMSANDNDHGNVCGQQLPLNRAEEKKKETEDQASYQKVGCPRIFLSSQPASRFQCHKNSFEAWKKWHETHREGT